MKKSVVMFPGQGSQYLGMISKLLTFDDSILPIIKELEESSGIDLLKIDISGDVEEIMCPTVSQPMILVTSFGYYQYIKKQLDFEPSIFTGHSMGEISALVCSGKMKLNDAIDFTIKRGEIIEKNIKNCYEMVAIIGNGVEKYKEKFFEYGDISNINDENQIVITIHKNKFEFLEESLGKQYVFKLGIKYPFHTKFMLDIVPELDKILNTYQYNTNEKRVFSSTLLRNLETKEDIIEALSYQVVKPVNWIDVTKHLENEGIGTFIEVGPGRTLKNISLLNNWERSFYSIADIEDYNQLLNEKYGIVNEFVSDQNIFEFIKSLIKICVTSKNLTNKNEFVYYYKNLKVNCEKHISTGVLPTPLALNKLVTNTKQVLNKKGYFPIEINRKISKEIIRKNIFDVIDLEEEIISYIKELN